MKNKLPSKTKEILNERLKSYANTTKRVSWEEIKANVRKLSLKEGKKLAYKLIDKKNANR